ncbi:CIA30 family protein [Urechidicola vernalis]|uniref:CIA30 family protein n=1 Tax=Urechidicola vernalis TaxID=3075600 RepID=A0ABU2Y197_9FLAO|nr:CIA30 family protein [Urechidicola sp. P050]MDT0551974.1 CIA30 family protein [Urechidicola sp. P050]
MYFLFVYILIMGSQMKELMLFESSQDNSINEWRIVNDGVMGGVSQGFITSNSSRNLVYNGNISLRNNGGFSSMRLRVNERDVSKYNAIKVKLKGDRKNYQFRIKSETFDRHSYVYEFSTDNNWEEIIMPFNHFKPQFRGRKLDMKEYNGESIAEIAILIGNKVEESFILEIDSISLIKIED